MGKKMSIIKQGAKSAGFAAARVTRSCFNRVRSFRPGKKRSARDGFDRAFTERANCVSLVRGYAAEHGGSTSVSDEAIAKAFIEVVGRRI